MTVSELMAELASYPSHAKVIIWDEGRKDYRPVKRGDIAAVYETGGNGEVYSK
jgi:hypothetical protein